MESLRLWWQSLGPLGPCAVLFLIGVLLVLGFIFRWEWLSPGHANMRYRASWFRRAWTLMSGVLLILCSILFYIYRDKMHWG